MKKINRLSFVLLSLMFLSIHAFGQTESRMGGSAENTFRGFKNKPYSTESIRETVRTLPDCNTITETSKTLEYRDSEGRTRREEVSQTPVRPYSSNTINIYDPIGGYTYTLFTNDKTVFRIKLSAPRQFVQLEPPTGYSRKIEPLGNRIIEGLEARGTRGVSTIAPGTIGNAKEIQTVSEGWSSVELGVTLLSTTNDPRYGITTTRLINIKRDEPDKSLFEIPADYKIIDREPLRPTMSAPNPANSSSNESKKP